MTITEEQLAMFAFEGKLPDASRHSISGSFATSDDEPNLLPDLHLDDLIVLRCVGKVTAIKHARQKDGAMERQHVIVLQAASPLSALPEGWEIAPAGEEA